MDQVQTYAELLRTMSPGQIHRAGRSGGLARVRRGVRAPRPPSLAQRVRAEQLTEPAAAASHHTAAALLGLDVDDDVLHLTLPHRLVRRRRPGVVVHRSRRAFGVVRVGDLLVTAPARTVLDLARWCPYVEGLVVADAALQAGLVQAAELHRELKQAAGLDGVPRARRVVEACRRGAESPLESRVRAALSAGGVPEAVLQHVAVTAAGPCRVDLAWPAARVCVEVDGWAWHAGREAFVRDRRRWRALSAAGWEVHPVSAADLARPAVLAAEVLGSLRRRC